MRRRKRPSFPGACCKRMTNCSYPSRTRTGMISLYRLQSTCEQHCPFRCSLRNFMLSVLTFGGCARLFHPDYQLCGPSFLIHCFPPYVAPFHRIITTSLQPPLLIFLPPSDALFLQFCKLVCVWVEKWTESGRNGRLQRAALR